MLKKTYGKQNENNQYHSRWMRERAQGKELLTLSEQMKYHDRLTNERVNFFFALKRHRWTLEEFLSVLLLMQSVFRANLETIISNDLTYKKVSYCVYKL